MKKKLKWKAFKIAVGQELTSDHKKQRREFCQWLLDQPEDLPQKIIFGDDKWFVLKKEANRQSTQHCWAASYQLIRVQVWKGSRRKKVMAFVAMVDFHKTDKDYVKLLGLTIIKKVRVD